MKEISNGLSWMGEEILGFRCSVNKVSNKRRFPGGAVPVASLCNLEGPAESTVLLLWCCVGPGTSALPFAHPSPCILMKKKIIDSLKVFLFLLLSVLL